GNFRIGSQVIVRESQNAVFFRDGRALDTFGPGRHIISTGNIPVLIDFVGRLFNDKTPFPAEVYFVSMREFPDMKWGTPDAIPVQTPGVGVGWQVLTGFGTYGFQVSNPQQFVAQVVGAQGLYTTRDIEDRLRGIFAQKLADLLGEQAVKLGPNFMARLSGLRNEIAAGLRAQSQDDFNALGLALKTILIGGLSPAQNAMQILRDRNLISSEGAALYAQLQAADAMRDAANNPSGGAGLTAGIGAGVGIGNLMGQALSGMQQPPAQPQPQTPQAPQGGGGAAGAAAFPDIMSPADAARYMQVTEADVMQMITEGQLKAKKIGAQYRISKSALDDFLKS
ncbi:MAG: SPFH domain-containing protein, partial [Anaerolineales bacterium]